MAPVAAKGAPPLFTDGFESGTLSGWTVTGGVTIDGTAHAGSWGVRATAANGVAWAYHGLGASVPEVYVRTWFRAASLASTATLLRVRTATGTSLYSVGLTKSGKLTTSSNTTGTTVNSTTGVATGSWHQVQIHARTGTAGQVDVWLDGVPVLDLSRTLSLGTAPIGRLQIGENATGRTFDVAFDDVTADTAFISDGPPPVDTGPPSIPGGLQASVQNAGPVRLSWQPSHDDVAVTGYEIKRWEAGVPTVVGSTTGATTYDDGATQPQTDYTYTVVARDAVGNRSGDSNAASVHTPDRPPNIVLFLTDDQPFDTIDRMPTVQRELVAKGIVFPNGFVSDSLCCPSRISILRGQYSHTTGVYDIAEPFGAWARVNALHLESSTLGTWLHDDGYRTALIGKYLNEYKINFNPPGWSFWRGAVGNYYDYRVNEDGFIRSYGSAPADYKTAVLSRYADEFIKSTPTGQPLYLEVTPFAPHEPFTPEPKYASDPRCTSATNTDAPAFNEADVSDKPGYVRSKKLSPAQLVEAGTTRVQMQCRALLSVDDMVSTVMQDMADAGRLQNTLFIYSSDNGLMNGEHRLRTKKAPYESSIKVPFVVRYDPLTAARAPAIDPRMVVNVDIAPTITDLLDLNITPGCPVPQYSPLCTGAFDGQSFLPLLANPAAPGRSSFLIEHYETPSSTWVPAYCGVRTDHYKLVRYTTGEQELYNLSTDPNEMQNLMASPLSPANQAVHDQLFTQLFGAGGLCLPPPPNYPLP